MVSDSKDRKFGNYKDLTFQDSFAGIRIAEMEASSGLETEEQGDWLDFLPADNLGDPERQDVEVTSNHFKIMLGFHVCLFVCLCWEGSFSDQGSVFNSNVVFREVE